MATVQANPDPLQAKVYRMRQSGMTYRAISELLGGVLGGMSQYRVRAMCRRESAKLAK